MTDQSQDESGDETIRSLSDLIGLVRSDRTIGLLITAAAAVMLLNVVAAAIIAACFDGEAGQFGDVFGFSTSVFTAASTLFFIVALFAQMQQLQAQREELKLSRQAAIDEGKRHSDEMQLLRDEMEATASAATEDNQRIRESIDAQRTAIEVQGKQLAAQLDAREKPFLAIDFTYPLLHASRNSVTKEIEFWLAGPGGAPCTIANAGEGTALHVTSRTLAVTCREMPELKRILEEESQAPLFNAVGVERWWHGTSLAYILPGSERVELRGNERTVVNLRGAFDPDDETPMPFYALNLLTCADRWGRSWGFWTLTSIGTTVNRRDVERALESGRKFAIPVTATLAYLGAYELDRRGFRRPVRLVQPE